MADKSGDTPRCAVLVGPYLSGKTSLFEALLLATGTLHKKGMVRDGSTVGDSAEESRKRQASTELTLGRGRFLDEDWIFIDTPGGLDFNQDMRNACMVADIAIVVADPEVEKAAALTPYLKFLDAHDIPHVIFVNKIEESNDRMRDIMHALQDVSDRPVALRQVPIRDGGDVVTGYVDLVSERAYQYQNGKPSKLVQIPDAVADREKEARNEMLETLSDFDDALLEQLLEDVEPAAPDVYNQLTETLQGDLVVPVLLGGAEKEKVTELEQDVNEMAISLQQANKQIELLNNYAIGDPFVKCIESFDQLPLARQEEALRKLLTTDSVAGVLTGLPGTIDCNMEAAAQLLRGLFSGGH